MPKWNFTDLIAFENDDYLLVNKPSGISTLDDRGGEPHLLALGKEIHPDLQACHRLDKETSGTLAFAKNPEAYRALAMQFERRQVNKIYHAICDGLHDFDQQMVNAGISMLTKGIVKIDKKDGKPATTIFNTLDVYKAHTLMECRPVTGRMHQIRIHLAYLKASITGDTQYGGKPLYLSDLKRKFNLKKDTEELPIMQRVALHAQALEFTLLNGEKIKVESPYPKDMAVAIKQLEKNR
ncbi:RNA pseudouridine synthase [Cytophagales bacterium LB-30]|uniref:RNA pseudouridine synthase n=1 Tax=Shiella aurantiaca TaxID=3058365 RepID=A0ABT8F8Y6_9BACT|nr:RNA pseudouridine synthase [Shiella aurantiaca]MDN4166892.1 RNA pseudouridine synthase [Shiella aurantiaca]